VHVTGQLLSYFDDGPEYRVEPSGDPLTALFTNLPPNDYTFVAEATNAAGHYISTPPVRVRIAPDNDNFSSARFVSDFGSQEFTLAGASEELGEPLLTDQVGSQSILFRWTPAIDQIVVASTPGHALGAFTGPDFNDLVPTGTYSPGVVRLEARAGVTYHFKVALSYGNRLGRFSLSSLVVNDDFAGRFAVSGSDFTIVVTNAVSSIEPNEPPHRTNEDRFTYPGSLWWSWTAPSAGVLVVYDPESGFWMDPLGYGRIINAYTGADLPNLTRRERFTNSVFGDAFAIRVADGETIHFALSATFAETNLLYRFRLLPDPPSNYLRAELIAPYYVIVSFQGEPGATYALENSPDFVSWVEAFQFYAEDTPTYIGPSVFCCSEFFRAHRVDPPPPED